MSKEQHLLSMLNCYCLTMMNNRYITHFLNCLSCFVDRCHTDVTLCLQLSSGTTTQRSIRLTTSEISSCSLNSPSNWRGRLLKYTRTSSGKTDVFVCVCLVGLFVVWSRVFVIGLILITAVDVRSCDLCFQNRRWRQFSAADNKALSDVLARDKI